MGSNIFKIFLAASAVILMLSGCNQKESDYVLAEPVSVEKEESKVIDIPNGDENIPSVEEIASSGTSEYDEISIQEKGYNEIAQSYNEMVSDFNDVNDRYAEDRLPQSDEVESELAEIGNKIEKVKNSIEKAASYKDAVAIAKEIKAIKEEIENVSVTIDNLG